MSFNVIALILFFVCVINPIYAQSEQRDKLPYVVAPSESGLLAIASQPDCPLQFENVRLLLRIDGREGGIDFQLRNRGTKPVKSVTWARWTFTEHDGTATSVNSWPRKVTDEAVMPGQLVPLSEGGDQEEIIPITDELRDKLKLRGPMTGVAVMMVLRVKYGDGTAYIDEGRIKSLQDELGQDIVKELIREEK